jgi:hypothetical protein
MDIDVKHCIKESKILRAKAAKIDGDAPGADFLKLDLLNDAYMYMGRVEAVREGEYMRVYALRKSTHAQAKASTGPNDKETRAELSIMELRMLEATAKEEWMLWKHERESVYQQLFTLHLKANRENKMSYGGGG